MSDGLYLGPCAPATEPEPWTDEQLARFAAEWRRKAQQRTKIRLPLPWPVRLRLACTRRVDKTAIWLVKHGRYRAAARLWRVFGMWRR